MQQITPQQALSILDQATQPAAAGKLNRADYINIQVALETLATFVDEHTEPPEKEKAQ